MQSNKPRAPYLRAAARQQQDAWSPGVSGGESSSGLGLSIVKRLAEAMDSAVKCESRLGEGPTFIVQLPKWSEAGPPDKA